MRIRVFGRSLLSLALLLGTGLLVAPQFVAPAHAEVVSAEANGFSLQIVVEIEAPMSRIYEALVNEVGQWWHPDHTYSLDAGNLSIDARPGGCFCELSEQVQVQHMEVVMVRPGRLLRMLGGLGPLQSFGLEGSMTFVLNPLEVFDPETEDLLLSQTASELELVYNVGGYGEGGLDTLAPIVDRVLTEQVMRLKTYTETGSPVVPSGEGDASGASE